MESSKEYVCRVHTSNMRAWLVYSEARQEWTAEVYLRRPGGVQFLEKRYVGEQPPERLLAADAMKLGWFSPRPVLLCQAFDPSMSHPVLFLFLHCCESRKYDTHKILRDAFPHITEELNLTVLEVAEQASWEDTRPPNGWTDPTHVERLLVALDQVGYRALADALQEVLMNG